jgi:hypothetical protein
MAAIIGSTISKNTMLDIDTPFVWQLYIHGDFKAHKSLKISR